MQNGAVEAAQDVETVTFMPRTGKLRLVKVGQPLKLVGGGRNSARADARPERPPPHMVDLPLLELRRDKEGKMGFAALPVSGERALL